MTDDARKQTKRDALAAAMTCPECRALRAIVEIGVVCVNGHGRIVPFAALGLAGLQPWVKECETGAELGREVESLLRRRFPQQVVEPRTRGEIAPPSPAAAGTGSRPLTPKRYRTVEEVNAAWERWREGVEESKSRILTSNPEPPMSSLWKETLRRWLKPRRKEPETIDPVPETIPVNPETPPAKPQTQAAPSRCLYYVNARRPFTTIVGASHRVDLYDDARDAEMKSATLAARGYCVDVYRLPCECPAEIARRIKAGEQIEIVAQPAWGYRPGQAKGMAIGVG